MCNFNRGATAPFGSHQAYAAHCATLGLRDRASSVYVQAWIDGMPSCCQVVRPRLFDGREWFVLRLVDGDEPFYRPASAVRPCSGIDGRCLCDELDGQAHAAGDRAGDAPADTAGALAAGAGWRGGLVTPPFFLTGEKAQGVAL